MAHDLLPAADLIDRTLRIETDYTVSRLMVLKHLSGNPVGVQVRDMGHGAVAMMARYFPNPNFNKVVGLRGGQVGEIKPLIRWYRDNGIRLRFEILPRQEDGELGRELASLGLYPAEFHTSLIRNAEPAGTGKGIAVEAVTTLNALEEFLDAYIAGWEIPDGAGFKRNVSPAWLNRPGWSLFVARIDDVPAAAAILYVGDRAAYLADACCDPRFRGRGLHAALLRERIEAARKYGVDFICSGAAFGSTSHRNMERADMRIQFIRSIWLEKN